MLNTTLEGFVELLLAKFSQHVMGNGASYTSAVNNPTNAKNQTKSKAAKSAAIAI